MTAVAGGGVASQRSGRVTTYGSFFALTFESTMELESYSPNAPRESERISRFSSWRGLSTEMRKRFQTRRRLFYDSTFTSTLSRRQLWYRRVSSVSYSYKQIRGELVAEADRSSLRITRTSEIIG